MDRKLALNTTKICANVVRLVRCGQKTLKRLIRANVVQLVRGGQKTLKRLIRANVVPLCSVSSWYTENSQTTKPVPNVFSLFVVNIKLSNDYICEKETLKRRHPLAENFETTTDKKCYP